MTDLTETIARVRQGFREIAAARQAAGVEPGEPLLGLDLDVSSPEGGAS